MPTLLKKLLCFNLLLMTLVFSSQANDELLKMLKAHNINKTEVEQIVEQMRRNGQINNTEAIDAKKALNEMNKKQFEDLQLKGHSLVKSKGMVNLSDTFQPSRGTANVDSVPNANQINSIMKAIKN